MVIDAACRSLPAGLPRIVVLLMTVRVVSLNSIFRAPPAIALMLSTDCKRRCCCLHYPHKQPVARSADICSLIAVSWLCGSKIVNVTIAGLSRIDQQLHM